MNNQEKDIRSSGLKVYEDDPKQFQERVDRLVTALDGVIKYTPMLLDHYEWSDKECLEFALKYQKIVSERLIEGKYEGWNEGIPYCRNDLEKALKRV